MSGEQRMVGTVGLMGIVVGYVVGASIFVLPGRLAVATGPGLFLSYLVAAVPAALAAVVGLRLARRYRQSGAGFLAVSAAYGPAAGFFLVFTLLVALTIGLPLVALGFADLVAALLPGTPRTVTAMGVTVLACALNLASLGSIARLQVALTTAKVAALLLFGVAGTLTAPESSLRPLLPHGLAPVLGAAIPAYFSYVGFLSVTEIAGEIRDPERTVPRAMAASVGLVVVAYVLAAIAVVGHLTPAELSSAPAPAALAASRFLPALAPAITVAAAVSAATALNAVVLALSRDVAALAQAGLLPRRLAQRAPATGAPRAAVLSLGGLFLLGIGLGAPLEDYAVLAVAGFCLTQILVGLAARRLGDGRLAPLGLALISGLFLAHALWSNPWGAALVGASTALGLVLSWRATRA